ncbi:MAG: phosphotyrosine protein phosphatase [Lachnospiraceae bacterium]|nr:phosphotyrosine protein phosphatase [Lachnospiraceae bacterium]
MDYEKVIFVTNSDTSRGPMAAAILQKNLRFTNIIAESKGMVVLFPEPMNAKMVAVAASKGFDLSKYTSRPLEEEDFGTNVLVLVLEESNKQKIYDSFEKAINVYSVKEFINEPGSFIDPYGGELADYGKAYDDLEDGIIKLAQKIKYE